MKPIARSLAAALTWVLLGLPINSAAFAQTETPGADRQNGPDEPTVLSVFTLARELIESATTEYSRQRGEIRNEAIRLPLRYVLAQSMRRTGQEAAFGDYVVRALDAWEVWDPQRASLKREALRKNEEIEAQARRAFLAGDQESARRLLGERDCQDVWFLTLYCMSPEAALEQLFLNWELGAGDLPAAARRVRQTDWKGRNTRLYSAARVACAFVDAGRPDEGFQILSELRSSPEADQALLAQTYWRLGAVEQGRTLMREAASAALDDAARDSNWVLAVPIAGVQLSMGDREGALDTLRRIRQFDAERIGLVRSSLAGRLAFAGLDSEAAALVDGTLADRGTLANIVVGQARRGDFAAAFATLEQLRKLPAATSEDNASNPGIRTAIASIARNAARAGDTGAFRQADAIRREINPGPCIATARSDGISLSLREDSDTQSLRDLSHAGRARMAVDYALTFPDPFKRIEGLAMIAEGLAGLPDPSYDPLGFFDSWSLATPSCS